MNRGVAIERSNFAMLERIHDQRIVSPEIISTQRLFNEVLVEKLDTEIVKLIKMNHRTMSLLWIQQFLYLH
jgi:hypothetical protein